LLEARLPPGEGVLGGLLATAWLAPRIAIAGIDRAASTRPGALDAWSEPGVMAILPPFDEAHVDRQSATDQDIRTTPAIASADISGVGAGLFEPIGVLDGDALGGWQPSALSGWSAASAAGAHTADQGFGNPTSGTAVTDGRTEGMSTGLVLDSPVGIGSSSSPGSAADLSLGSSASADLTRRSSGARIGGSDLGSSILPPLSGATVSAVTGAGLAGFGFVSHQRLHAGTSAVTSTSSLAPTSRVTTALGQAGQRGRRPNRFLAAANPNGSGKPAVLNLHQPTKLDATGITGSVSPVTFLPGKSDLNPANVAKQVKTYHPPISGLNPAADPLRGWKEQQVTGAIAPAGGRSRSGDEGPPPPPPGGMTQDDHVRGSFTFTLNLHGSDDQGAYALRETGTGRFVGGDPSQRQIGTITITTRIHRGGGEVSDSDPPTTETRSFDPNGAGALVGFDIDGYTASRFGIALSTVTAYSLDANGSDRFSDNDSAAETTQPSSGETETDTETYSDSGSEPFHLSLTGSGASRAYTLDLTSNVRYTLTENDVDQRSLSDQTSSETYHETNNGSEIVTDHDTGTIGADGILRLATFRVGDTINDTVTDTDSGSGTKTTTQDSGRENFADSESTSDAESVTITGSPDTWTITVNDRNQGSVSERDQGNGHVTGAISGPGTYQDDEQWDESAGGNLTETLSVTATGHGASGDVTIQGVTFSDVGWDIFGATDSDAEVGTIGQDRSTETQSESGSGRNDFSLTINSPDGVNFPVVESETIVNNFADGDNGTDTWNDPYHRDDPPLDGTEHGSDQFNQTDRGTETTRVSSHWGVDANDHFRLDSFDANVSGSGGESGGDSGDGTVSVSDETDTERYTDTGNATNTYHTHVTNNGGPTTTVDMDVTSAGRWGDTDTDLDQWMGPADSGHDQNSETDTDTATISGRQSGVVDAQGQYTQTSMTARIDAMDRFGNQDNLDDDRHTGQDEEDVQQNSGVTGTDDCHVNVTQTADGAVTLSDDEGITEALNLGANITDAGHDGDGGGTGHLSGPVTAHIHQSGHTQSGEFRFDPANGDDSVNVSGDYDKRTTVVTQGMIPGTTDMYYGHVIEPTPPLLVLDGGSAAAANHAVVTTEVTDTGLHVGESDAEASGHWSVGSVDYHDSPGVTVTAAVTFGYIVPGGPSGSAAGTETVFDRQSEEETVQGSGAGAHVSLTTRNEHSDDGNVTGSLPGYSGSVNWHSANSTRHTIDGNETDRQHDQMQDTTVFHSEEHEVADVDRQADGDPRLTRFRLHRMVDAADDYTATDTLTNGQSVITGYSGSGLRSETNTTTLIGPVGTLVTTITWMTSTTHRSLQGLPDDHVDRVGTGLRDGTDPFTGHVYHNESYDPGASHNDNRGPTDWFDAVATFAAGVGDKISGGLTRRIRQTLGYDDVVHYNSRAYAAGEVVGEVINQGVQNLTPCRFVGVARAGVRALHAVQAASHAWDAAESFQNWDVIGGLQSLQAARSSFGSMRLSCFAAGTPLRTPGGSTPSVTWSCRATSTTRTPRFRSRRSRRCSSARRRSSTSASEARSFARPLSTRSGSKTAAGREPVSSWRAIAWPLWKPAAGCRWRRSRTPTPGKPSTTFGSPTTIPTSSAT
jgi:hypothetical protein